MTTGRIDYSPDYKSEKRMSKYRRETIFGSTEMDLSDGPTWKVSPADSPSEDIAALARIERNEAVATERARLERAVIEAAKKWREDWLFNAKDLRSAIDALLEFEAKQDQIKN